MDRDNSKRVPVKRRRVLQGISLAGVGGLASTGLTSAARGETYEVHLWQSSALSSFCTGHHGDPYRAMDNAKTCLEEAMESTRNDIDVITHTHEVSVPEENAYTSFWARYPCDPSTAGYYSNNLGWWRDYHSCKNLPSARDTNVLLTSTDSPRGGRSERGGPYTVVQPGQLLAKASLYRSHARKSNDVQNGVEGLLHEVGHAFQMSNTEAEEVHDNPNYGVHKTGRSISHWYGDAITPLGHGSQESKNECGKSVGTLNGFEQTYSGCTQDYWSNSG